MKMKLMITLYSGFFLTSVLSQGFLPQFKPVPDETINPQRRQLTPAQQTHILSDIQQHQHRFALHQQQEPSQFGNQNYLLNQQQSQNNFRTVNPPVVSSEFPPSIAPNNANFDRQHHTQTNFVPNYQQQQPFPVQQQQQQIFQAQPLLSQSQQRQQYQNEINPTYDNGQFAQQSAQPTIQTQTNTGIQQVFSQFQQSSPFSSAATPIQQNFQPQLQSTSNFNGQTANRFLSSVQPTHQVPFVPSQTLQENYPNQNFGNFNPLSVHSQPQPLPQRIFDSKEEEERVKEQRERQKLIEKHEKFVQKQHQKQQQKARQEHDKFVQQQEKINQETRSRIRPSQQSESNNYSPSITRSRGIFPSEVPLFNKALQHYFELHPTTTTTTTTTTTPAPPTTTTTTTEPPPFLVTAPSRNIVSRQRDALATEDLELLLQGQHQKLFEQLRQHENTEKRSSGKSSGNKSKAKSTKALGRDDLIKQLKLALAEQPELGTKNYTTMDLVLPDGQKVQVIRTTDPRLIDGAQPLQDETALPSNIHHQSPFSIEDLTKQGILPPGTDFEVVGQGDGGDIKPEIKIPPQKKVTFVYLEEQHDGTYKVQGVKGNGDKEPKTTGVEVDSILKRIKNGEIKLPPPTNTGSATTKQPEIRHTVQQPETRHTAQQPEIRYPSSVSVIPLSTPYDERESATPNNVIARSVHRGTPQNSIAYSSPSPTTPFATTIPITTIRPYFASTRSPSSTHFPISTHEYADYSTMTHAPSPPPPPPPSSSPEQAKFIETTIKQTVTPSLVTYYEEPEFTTTSKPFYDLPAILKSRGLHAMAKFLKQSGLDSILNETGPYTVFAPTDKAFKNLLVQLGGPERAEEKFKNNPRLLSGLLLHHVIPGSFEITSLQDEMTGVSLAGTQLRVNQYTLHDSEWNDIKITTINGAMVTPERQDIIIPQGIAHGIDRVMFPLPVGDLLQTLQSDRERRFTQFLRALFASGLSEMLQSKGAKTYTVFAPSDSAFTSLSPEELNRVTSDKDSAQALVMKHIIPGTLYTAGMRFYQVKDSLATGKPITIQKTNGVSKVKVNDGQILTSNIPSTTGVIHAIDVLL